MLFVAGSRSLFVTGGTGFIGRQLLGALEGAEFGQIRCLTRGQPPAWGSRRVEFLRGDVASAPTYVDALRQADVVVHLAAQTGKAAPAEHMRANVDSTRVLLDACRDAGVRRFVYASSIAATYRDKTTYPYAASKARAEELVRESGLSYVIVRPTFVLGHGSPLWSGLAALAKLPVMPIFGDGQVPTQPVYVGDVANRLRAIVDQDRLDGEVVEVGGPDVVTIEELLRRIRRTLLGHDSRVVHLPASLSIGLLAWVDPWLRPVLPVTAGQLSAFVNDSTAHGNHQPPMTTPLTSLNEMIRRSAADGR